MPLPYTWEELARMSGARLLVPGDTAAGHFVVDSRAVQPGDVFVALKGERADGHDFLKEVFERGAGGCLVARRPVKDGIPAGVAVLEAEDPLRALQTLARAHRERCPATVIGITGSNGKTTTKEMLAHVFKTANKRVVATRGNLNSQIGLPLMLLELDKSHTHAVLEMGASTRGDIARLAEWARPKVGVLTSIGRAHLEFFGSPEAVAEAKWELVESLPKDGVAFLNADDPALMARRSSARCSVVLFGTGAGADVRAENVRQDPLTQFDLVVGGARRTVRLPVPGVFNALNALAAAAVSLWERVPLQTVAAALESFPPPPGRMQVRRLADGSVFVLDAYNANPDSMAGGLRSFVGAYPERPRAAVLGSMLELGSHAEAEHRALGRLLGALSLQQVCFLGPEAEWVRAGFSEAGGKGLFVGSDSPEEILSFLRKNPMAGAAVFFKGSRGARLERLYDPLLNPAGADPVGGEHESRRP